MKTFRLELILLAFILSCTGQEKEKTIEYYFEFIDQINSRQSQYVQNHINELLPNKKYLITNTSQFSWPFYESFLPDYKIPKEDLLAPHLYAHRFLPIKDYSESIQDGKLKLTIIYMIKDEGKPGLDMTSFNWDGDKWVKHVHLGYFLIPKKYSLSNSQCAKRVTETIIRYSFK